MISPRSLTVKVYCERLMQGGMTVSPMSRASLMKRTILSIFSISEVSTAAISSAG